MVFSARAIPGNEKAIGRVMNHVSRRGAEVVHEGTRHVHVSGHGNEEELKLMLSLVKPRYFVPIHGEYRQLARLRMVLPSISLHAFTATATARVRRDIAEQLGLRNPLELVGSFRFNDEIDAVIAALADGSLVIDAVLTHEYPVARALEAFTVAKDASRSSKVLLRFGD